MPRVKLTAPLGTDEANFGTERLRVDNDGTVDVPEEAVDSLVHMGGFIRDPAAHQAHDDGTVPMRHPEGIGCSVGGVECAPDANGVVMVPSGAVASLAAHGFMAVDAPSQE
jgi:hypothetical protein